MENIFHRVSIRRYQKKNVEKEKIEQILRAGMQAPSAVNQQPLDFYVVTDHAVLQKLSQVSPYAGMTADAPAAIVSAYHTDCTLPEMAPLDLSIAMENIWLETDALGLGGVWLGIAPEEERMKKTEEILHLPENERAFAIFPLGYPAEEKHQQDRFDRKKIHWIR